MVESSELKVPWEKFVEYEALHDNVVKQVSRLHENDEMRKPMLEMVIPE